MTKERYQNPVVGDTVVLRQLIYNNNQLTDVNSINRVEIWKVDDQDPNNINKRVLIQTIDGSDVVHYGDGQYFVDVLLEEALYCVGGYIDIWYISFQVSNQEQCEV